MNLIWSLLDMDMYKFTMGQFVFYNYSDVNVTFKLKNRTKGIKLEDWIDEDDLREGLNSVKMMKFKNCELNWLLSLGIFSEEYISFLKNMSLPDFSLKKNGHSFDLEFDGPWSSVIYWEVIALAVINELYANSRFSKLPRYEQRKIVQDAETALNDKIKRLNYLDAEIVEFGTRRRFSHSWQSNVLRALNESSAKLIGTSNMQLAREMEIKPMGTMAHELFMVIAGIAKDDDELLKSHNKVLDEWKNLYQDKLLIALSDTFGSDYFFSDMSLKQAKEWNGLRQDSGDPIEFGYKAIDFYESYGIDPREKTIVFSDGLDVDTIEKIYNEFNGKFKMSFGWGTNLTFDWPGIKPLSLVVKSVEANGFPLVKLSDNIAKAIGPEFEVQRYKRVFGYTNQESTVCRY